MNIQIMSDLHIDCDRDYGKAFVDSLDPKDVDVLVLAGDIISTTNYNRMHDLYKSLCAKYPNVILVPGNHEYWNDSVWRQENRFERLLEAFPNLTLLEDGEDVTINGQRFIGGTMWYSEQPNQLKFPDFRYIQNFEPWVYEKNKKFDENIRKNLTSEDIVITHHVPTNKSVPPEYVGDPWNCFFVNDLEDVIKEKQPKIWIHGHTHVHFDYMIDKTRIICNPRGYPAEVTTFDPALKVTV